MAGFRSFRRDGHICHKTLDLIKSYIILYKGSSSVLNVLLYFTLTKVSANTVLWSF